jgi:glutamate synthase (NADPH/NADH) large chain
VLSNAEFAAMRTYMGDTACVVDCTWALTEGEAGLRRQLDRICRQAEEGVRAGCTHVIMTDEDQSAERAPIPMVLAVGAVHTHLVRNSLRTFTSLNVRDAECMDVHSFAVLIGAGATTVNAYMAQESITDRHRRGLFGDLSLQDCVARYKKAVDKGLLKIMSKMGISVLSSYRGGMNFEAIGLSRALVAEFFPGIQSRISGIGLSGIARRVLALHRKAWAEDTVALPVGGLYKLRRRGEVHAFDGSLIHTLQRAVETDSYQTFKRYSDAVRKLPPVALRDLLDFRSQGRTPVPLEEVESITEIRKRLLAPGISLGQRRGWRGPLPRPAARQWRQRQQRHQADRLRPLRRDGGIPERLPRDRDQGGTGRQARRGWAAARLQGDRPDRQAAALDPRRHADLAAAAP